MICRYYQHGQQLDVAGLNVVTLLLDRSETLLTEVGWNRWRKGLEGPPHSHDAKEKSFEEMYNRVAPDRIARWKSGDITVGE